MIVCCGESLIDMLPRTLDNGEDAYHPVPGGAQLNTAIALGRLGEDTAFVSGISTDMFGEHLIRFLEDSHVSTAYCVRSARPTTLAFVKLNSGAAQYSFYDENTAGRMLEIDDLPHLPDHVDAIHCGAISLVAEPCGSAFEHLIHNHKDRHVISFDPNIRPAFVTDEAAYRDRLHRIAGVSDIIKVSDEDLAWLSPHTAFEDVAQLWFSRGTSIALLTSGEKGVRALTPSLDLTVAAQCVEVVDTVGAGDCFNAGFLARLRECDVLSKSQLKRIEPDVLKSALTFGAKVAAFVAGQAGSNPPWRDALEQMT